VHSVVQQFSRKLALGPGSHCSLESSIPSPHTTLLDENTEPDFETTAGIDLDAEVGFGFWRVSEGVLDWERDEETEAFTTTDREAVEEAAPPELMITTVEREPDEEAAPPELRLRLTELTFREVEREWEPDAGPPERERELDAGTDVPATACDFDFDPDDDPAAPTELLGDAAAADKDIDSEPEKDCPGAATIYM